MGSRSKRSRKLRSGPSAVLRFIQRLVAVVALAAATAIFYLILRSHDPLYVLREIKNWSDYRRYDALIARMAEENHVDPLLVKAIVWRESRFQSDMTGRNGERGLMQVSEVAAHDWAQANGNVSFSPSDLFDPELNLRIGCWYLSKALQRWNGRADAVPFALAEYNAGRSRVDRWVKAAQQKGQTVDARTFEDSIDFPSTAHYVQTIIARYDFYKQRGPLVKTE